MNEIKVAGYLSSGPLIKAFESVTYADFLLLTPYEYHAYYEVPCHMQVPPERMGNVKRGNYFSLQGRVHFTGGNLFAVEDCNVTAAVFVNPSSVKCNYELITDFFKQRKYREAYRFIRNLSGVICTMGDNEISECYTTFSKHLGNREARIFKEMTLEKYVGIEACDALLKELTEAFPITPRTRRRGFPMFEFK